MLLAGLYLCLSLLEAASAFRICAFNVQAFGDSKASDRGVMEVLVKALVISDHYPVEVELRLSSGQQEVHIHHYLIGIAVAVLLLSVMCGPNGCSGF
ncbi:UNVERIFIED_CONTAM: hypothetical protein FKN15_008644 [Acipenser sinensis]